jgi:hypothetical protein
LFSHLFFDMIMVVGLKRDNEEEEGWYL